MGPDRFYNTAGEVTKEIHPLYLSLQGLSEACGLVNSQMAEDTDRNIIFALSTFHFLVCT